MPNIPPRNLVVSRPHIRHVGCSSTKLGTVRAMMAATEPAEITGVAEKSRSTVDSWSPVS